MNFNSPENTVNTTSYKCNNLYWKSDYVGNYDEHLADIEQKKIK